MDINLNFINQSNDGGNSNVVIFQKNVATEFNELSDGPSMSNGAIFQKRAAPGLGEQAVAWQVIRNCARGDNHPFVFPTSIYVAAGDSYGNFTPQLAAQSGQLFEMVRTSSGDQLKLAGSATNPSEVHVRNAMPQGAVDANIYRGGLLLATKTALAPQQKAAFQFKPTIWIGVVSQIAEGQVVNSAILTQVNTEVSLLGVASADIVMTGGGPGPSSTPFRFSLANVVAA